MKEEEETVKKKVHRIAKKFYYPWVKTSLCGTHANGETGVRVWEKVTCEKCLKKKIS